MAMWRVNFHRGRKKRSEEAVRGQLWVEQRLGRSGVEQVACGGALSLLQEGPGCALCSRRRESQSEARDRDWVHVIH